MDCVDYNARYYVHNSTAAIVAAMYEVITLFCKRVLNHPAEVSSNMRHTTHVHATNTVGHAAANYGACCRLETAARDTVLIRFILFVVDVPCNLPGHDPDCR